MSWLYALSQTKTSKTHIILHSNQIKTNVENKMMRLVYVIPFVFDNIENVLVICDLYSKFHFLMHVHVQPVNMARNVVDKIQQDDVAVVGNNRNHEHNHPQ